MAQIDSKQNIQSALAAFKTGSLSQNAITLFDALGYNTTRQQPFQQKTWAYFNDYYVSDNSNFNSEAAKVSQWQSVDLLFQLSIDEVSDQQTLFATHQVEQTIIESYLFFALELIPEAYSRTELAHITREINKVFSMPVMILFKHGDNITLSVINRRLHKTNTLKDVLEKVTLIKDIAINQTHRAHIEILSDLSFAKIRKDYKVSNFVELHNAWQKILDTKQLNKKFYKELSQWYFWAITKVYFPSSTAEEQAGGIFAQDDKVQEHNAKNLIRLLTRILFVWFIKEKDLIPDELFDETYIREHLITDFSPKKDENISRQKQHSKYYRAILQNLFFATLNQTAGKRVFRNDKQHRNVTQLMRYENYFKDPQVFLKLVEDKVPFMNGGLFECLDRPDPLLKGRQGGDVILYEDGFSDRPDNLLRVPDYIFFDGDQHADLSVELGDKKQKDVRIYGLINILKAYKFTVTENTPIEEDIALDPELLGQVFENLLASYNPETKTTARKQTGSFYTPREIVDYMVDESLIAYLGSVESGGQALPDSGEACTPKIDKLRALLSYNDLPNPFNETETTQLITAIDTCKILDPACGSGAFPMGILHKLVHILHKLDPQNQRWQERQLEKARLIDDVAIRDQLLEDIEAAFTNNELDYGRKLYLIENCIYGVDIQPIATQISKLRFFISLIVDQKSDRSKDNFGIRPLPNLEAKFVAANTLISIDKPKIGLNADSTCSLFENKEIEVLENQLKEVRHRLFSSKTPANKRKLREEDKSLREKISELLKEQGWGNATAQQLANWNPYDQNASADFFDVEWMFGESGFNIVIGNPPYIKEYTNKAAFDGLRASPYYQGKMDLWYLFACKNLEITKNKTGILTFIATNNWTTSTGASKIRSKILNEATIEKLLDFGSYMIFESADIQTMIMIFRNNGSNDNYSFDLRRLIGDKLTFTDALDLIEKKKTLKNELLSPIISKDNFYGKSLTFSNNILEVVLDKIRQRSNFNLTKNEVANGIHPHYDYVSKASKNILGPNFKVGQGIFVLSENEKIDLTLNEKELKIVKPYFTTAQLRKWYGNKENKEWIIYTDSKFKNAVNINPYPNIKRHLDQFQNVITSSNKPYGLHRARNEYFFKNQKIIALRKCVGEPIFTYTDFDCYVSATFYVIKSERIDLKYLTAIFNSKLVAFWLRNKGKMQGRNYQLDKEPLLDIPIYKTAKNEQKPFIKLVDYILYITSQPSYTSTDLAYAEERLMVNFLENLINAMVYELYFPDELHEAGKYFISLIEKENLPDLNTIQADKLSVLKQITQRLTDKDHPLYVNLFFLDSVSVVRVIEGKE